ncbi:hypothetical protein F5884DRAFT_900304 [Xylogone sp. PMI_703]|nr:hypothetical protein F5884DRAFT_900304 [Xylogone sp. PMI_703]
MPRNKRKITRNIHKEEKQVSTTMSGPMIADEHNGHHDGIRTGNENHDGIDEKKENEVEKKDKTNKATNTTAEEIDRLLKLLAKRRGDGEKNMGDGMLADQSCHSSAAAAGGGGGEKEEEKQDDKAKHSSTTLPHQTPDITTYELLDIELNPRGMTRLSSWVVVENDIGGSSGEEVSGGREDWEDCEAECELDDEAEEEEQVRKWW